MIIIGLVGHFVVIVYDALVGQLFERHSVFYCEVCNGKMCCGCYRCHEFRCTRYREKCEQGVKKGKDSLTS